MHIVMVRNMTILQPVSVSLTLQICFYAKEIPLRLSLSTHQ